jgi:hypothetical protein
MLNGGLPNEDVKKVIKCTDSGHWKISRLCGTEKNALGSLSVPVADSSLCCIEQVGGALSQLECEGADLALKVQLQ